MTDRVREAWEEWAEEQARKCGMDPDYFADHEAAFRAGAEWMASGLKGSLGEFMERIRALTEDSDG